MQFIIIIILPTLRPSSHLSRED